MKINLQDYLILKLTFNTSKTGIVTIKTIDEKIICKAGGYGYDKKALCFKRLFQQLGFNLSIICYSKFDIDSSTIEQMNKFLNELNINYKINYKSQINKSIDFIELEKI